MCDLQHPEGQKKKEVGISDKTAVAWIQLRAGSVGIQLWSQNNTSKKGRNSVLELNESNRLYLVRDFFSEGNCWQTKRTLCGYLIHLEKFKAGKWELNRRSLKFCFAVCVCVWMWMCAFNWYLSQFYYFMRGSFIFWNSKGSKKNPQAWTWTSLYSWRKFTS